MAERGHDSTPPPRTIPEIVWQARKEAGAHAGDYHLVWLLARELANEAILRELGRQGLLAADRLADYLSIIGLNGQGVRAAERARGRRPPTR
ncbi:MAG TPA: hypothetical protein VGF25_19730 [Thermoleophilaceae bacterium]|jgi:hypothetical protein